MDQIYSMMKIPNNQKKDSSSLKQTSTCFQVQKTFGKDRLQAPDTTKDLHPEITTTCAKRKAKAARDQRQASARKWSVFLTTLRIGTSKTCLTLTVVHQ